MEFGNGYLSFDKGTGVFEGRGDEHGDGSVEEGDTTANFAGQRVEIRGRGTAFSACVGTVFAGAEAGERMAKAQCCDALELWAREVQGLVFGGRAVDGAIPSAICGEEASLLIFG